MTLTRLLYVSTKNDDVSADAIEAILNAARKENKKSHITGLLCFTGNVFLQVLEGDRAKVSALYNKIAKDNRHHSVTLLQFNAIEKREFSGWSMGYVPESRLTSAAILKYSSSTEFTPYDMPSESILHMMLELKAVTPVV